MSENQGFKPSAIAAYSDLFQRVRDPIFLIHAETFRILEANLACEHAFGYPPEQLVGTALPELIFKEAVDIKDGREHFEQCLRIARRRYYPRNVEALFRARDGRRLHIEAMVCVMKISEDQNILQVIAKNVTQIKETERRAAKYLEELKTANLQLEEMSLTDEMTGLYNFRFFKSESYKEHERAARYGTPYTLIFCDVDHFKNYNDVNGHPAGDEALRQVGAILRESCRNTDVAARYGGEEFVVLCPGVRVDGGRVLAERIRAAVAAYSFANREKQPLGFVSVSLGIASFPEDGRSLKDVLVSADLAVYASKNSGRNRVSIYREIRSEIPENMISKKVA